jgi:hypothetical protein
VSKEAQKANLCALGFREQSSRSRGLKKHFSE